MPSKCCDISCLVLWTSSPLLKAPVLSKKVLWLYHLKGDWDIPVTACQLLGHLHGCLQQHPCHQVMSPGDNKSPSLRKYLPSRIRFPICHCMPQPVLWPPCLMQCPPAARCCKPWPTSPVAHNSNPHSSFPRRCYMCSTIRTNGPGLHNTASIVSNIKWHSLWIYMQTGGGSVAGWTEVCSGMWIRVDKELSVSSSELAVLPQAGQSSVPRLPQCPLTQHPGRY